MVLFSSCRAFYVRPGRLRSTAPYLILDIGSWAFWHAGDKEVARLPHRCAMLCLRATMQLLASRRFPRRCSDDQLHHALTCRYLATPCRAIMDEFGRHRTARVEEE